jgi:hypothetical protein
VLILFTQALLKIWLRPSHEDLLIKNKSHGFCKGFISIAKLLTKALLMWELISITCSSSLAPHTFHARAFDLGTNIELSFVLSFLTFLSYHCHLSAKQSGRAGKIQFHCNGRGDTTVYKSLPLSEQYLLNVFRCAFTSGFQKKIHNLNSFSSIPSKKRVKQQ